MKAQAGKDVMSGHLAKPLPGQKSLLPEDEPDGAGTQQVTIRVSAQAVRILEEYSEANGLKRNRLFDEAVQVYAAMVAGGLRVKL